MTIGAKLEIRIGIFPLGSERPNQSTQDITVSSAMLSATPSPAARRWPQNSALRQRASVDDEARNELTVLLRRSLRRSGQTRWNFLEYGMFWNRPF